MQFIALLIVVQFLVMVMIFGWQIILLKIVDVIADIVHMKKQLETIMITFVQRNMRYFKFRKSRYLTSSLFKYVSNYNIFLYIIQNTKPNFNGFKRIILLYP